MAVLTPDSEGTLLHEIAFTLVHDGRSPDEIVEQLPMRGSEDDDAALWLYSWAVTQRLEGRPAHGLVPPPVSEWRPCREPRASRRRRRPSAPRSWLPRSARR